MPDMFGNPTFGDPGFVMQAQPMNQFSLPDWQGSGSSLTAPLNAPMGAMGAPTAVPQSGLQKTMGWLSNGNNLGTVVDGLGSLTQAYLGFKQLSMAKDQLKFQKESWGKNFANSQKNYNTSLEDRIRGRTSAYEGKENDVQSYLAKHKLGN